MLLQIITPEKTLFSEEIKLVQLPGLMGSFEIMKNHAPIISSLKEGEVRIIDPNDFEYKFHISGGVVECKLNNVFILTNKAQAVKY